VPSPSPLLLALRRFVAHHLTTFSMLGYDSSEDQRPITYLNGYPIYATTLLIIVHVVAFLLCAMMIGAGKCRRC
jgi:hypothetical protein